MIWNFPNLNPTNPPSPLTMNSDASLDDLISRHFDDATSAGESAALAQQLADDPSVALQFVHTARLHALLEAAAPPRAGRRSRILRRWAAFGAAAALIAVGAWAAIFFWSKPLTSSSRPRTVLDTGEHRSDRKPLPPGVKLRTVKNFASATTVPPASLDYLLSNFYVHADPNGLTVAEALNLLEQAIKEANLLRRPELDALRFTADTASLTPILDPSGRNQVPELRDDFKVQGIRSRSQIVSPLRQPYTIRDYLRVCALYCDVTQEPGGIRYVRDPRMAARDDVTLNNRVFRVNPDFISRYRIPHPPSQDPFQSQPAVAQKSSSEVLLEHFGITLSSPELSSFDSTSGRLFVKASQSKLDRLEAILEISENPRPVQLYLTTKYILCPPEVLPASFDAATGMLLSEVEFQKFSEHLSVAKGVDLATAPAVIMRPGQMAALVIQRDLPGSQPIAPGQSDWFGLRQEILTTCVGETIQVSGLVDLGMPATSGMVPFSEIIGNDNAFHNYGAESVRHHMTGYDIWVPNGYTAMFTLDVDTGGRGVAVACVTAQVVDPAGQ